MNVNGMTHTGCLLFNVDILKEELKNLHKDGASACSINFLTEDNKIETVDLLASENSPVIVPDGDGVYTNGEWAGDADVRNIIFDSLIDMAERVRRYYQHSFTNDALALAEIEIDSE